jgi:hypothetical protein
LFEELSNDVVRIQLQTLETVVFSSFEVLERPLLQPCQIDVDRLNFGSIEGCQVVLFGIEKLTVIVVGISHTDPDFNSLAKLAS